MPHSLTGCHKVAVQHCDRGGKTGNKLCCCRLMRSFFFFQWDRMQWCLLFYPCLSLYLSIMLWSVYVIRSFVIGLELAWLNSLGFCSKITPKHIKEAFAAFYFFFFLYVNAYMFACCSALFFTLSHIICLKGARTTLISAFEFYGTDMDMFFFFSFFLSFCILYFIRPTNKAIIITSFVCSVSGWKLEIYAEEEEENYIIEKNSLQFFLLLFVFFF